MGRVANPEMVVLARQSRGRSQGELAHDVGISQGLISKIEHGATAPASALLGHLGESLRYPVSFFYRPEHVRGSDSICFHHRKRSSMPARLLVTTEGQMYVTQLHVKSLLEDLEIVAENQFMTLDPDDYESSPVTVAQLLRRLWKIPRGPITNLVRVIEAAGGVVVFRKLGTPKLDGMSCWPKNCPPLFFINADIPVDRARLTLAHELGHLVMHSHAPAGDPEAEANDFALEFLAPGAEISPDLRQLRIGQLPGLKAHWRISMNAIVMAAKKTRALPDSRVKSLFVQLSQYGYRTSEPFPLSAEKPNLLHEAVRIHLRDHRYSVEQLAAMVDLQPDEFRSLYLPTQPHQLRVLS
jgi:Zn-dependent peptidase ImmA (M78 family)/DNA-binding XRE family transcriptional regulator